jgi:hypothetical protein
MKPKRKNFKKEDKIRMLLWCDRHCCLCDKSCGIDIEIAHINGNQDISFENGIPVCYDCPKIGMYNELHPRGNKISPEEIIRRREQIYDKYTRQYIVPIQYQITDFINPQTSSKRTFPDITFYVANLSDHMPIRLQIKLKGLLNGRPTDLKLGRGHYTGDKIWHLNPRQAVNGHFEIRNTKLHNLKNSDHLEIRVSITQIDILDRKHTFLEDGYALNKKGNYWYFEP